MERDKKIKFWQKEIQDWRTLEKSNSKNFIADVYKKYTDRFGEEELSETTNYEDSLANLLATNKEAHYNISKLDIVPHPVAKVEKLLFGENNNEKIKHQVNRLTEEERLKWIQNLGKTGCNLVGECKSSWKNIEDISWQLVEENMEFKRINLLYKDYDFNIPEDQMDNKTKKAWDEYLELANNLTYPKMDTQKFEKLTSNSWVQANFDSDILDFDSINAWGKNSWEVLEQILKENKKIYTNVPQTAYDIFSIYEPKSNFNLISDLLYRHWEIYPDKFRVWNLETKESAYNSFANDIKSSKDIQNVYNPEMELLGFNADEILQRFKKNLKKDEPTFKMKM
ncbi:hypothetical protein [Mesomycoplasma ovipneumoniae]|uniref:hypothetical protein n=1 Tax=Mesomycoplasma ovipneumoniae TaxID=29562 RepID=UPI00296449BA|nr:hypothetical protein [Mesomycoplasma ovipneumoniae]MDW2891222.1 hypothetical protein [Mesomycoplasma ovipneumoniae]